MNTEIRKGICLCVKFKSFASTYAVYFSRGACWCFDYSGIVFFRVLRRLLHWPKEDYANVVEAVYIMDAISVTTKALLLTISVAVGLPEVGTFMSLFSEVKVSRYSWSRSVLGLFVVLSHSIKLYHSLTFQSAHCDRATRTVLA